MVKRRAFILVCAVMLLLCISGIGEESAEDTAIARISNTEIFLRPEENKKLTIAYKNNKDRTKGSSAEWQSSDETIATVSDKGVVKGIETGQATISCTITLKNGESTTLSCLVNVRIPVTSLIQEEKSIQVKPGQTRKLLYSVQPEEATTQAVEWSSLDSDIASVDQEGQVTANAPGKTRIDAKTLDGSNKTIFWDVIVPGVYAEQDTYTLDTFGSIRIPVIFDGEDFEKEYKVETAGCELNYEVEILDHQAVFTITPEAAGEATLIVSERKKPANRSEIPIVITNEAIPSPKRLAITSAEILSGTKALTYKFLLSNISSEEVGEIGFLVDYRDQFGDTHYLLSNTDGSIANHQYTTMINIQPGGIGTVYGQNEVFRANDMIKEVRLAIYYYRYLSGQKVYIPDSQLYWFSTKTGEMERPEIHENYVQPDEDTFDRAARVSLGANTCSLYSYVVKEFSRSKRPGVFLSAIGENGNAAAWGLQRGDVIYGADGRLWTDEPFIMNRILCDVYDGKTVKLEVVRNGEEITIDIAKENK